MSPVRVGGDEAAHVRSIVAGVCHTQEIGKDAVGKLCSHVEADPQEEQVYTCTVYIHVHENMYMCRARCIEKKESPDPMHGM